ncbi:hypothetical protein [Salipiger pallidus]|nr:hypothetical protein [Salipiger pallidus]
MHQIELKEMLPPERIACERLEPLPVFNELDSNSLARAWTAGRSLKWSV